MVDSGLDDQSAFSLQMLLDIFVRFLYTGQAGNMSECGEELTLTFRPANSGTIDVNLPESSIGHGGISSGARIPEAMATR